MPSSSSCQRRGSCRLGAATHMTNPQARIWRPRREHLGVRHIVNGAGIRITVLANASVFAIEHLDPHGAVLINQLLASPVEGGIARILVRTGGIKPAIVEAVGPGAHIRFGCA